MKLDAPAAAVDLTTPCLPRSLAEANVALVRADGAHATVCYGHGDDSPGSVTHCLVLDETGAVIEARPWAKVAAARDTPRLQDGEVRYADGELTFCTAEKPIQCSQLEVALPRLADGVEVTGAVNPTRTHAFVFVPHAGAKVSWHGTFFDLRTEKQIGDVELASVDKLAFASTFHDAQWVGERVIVTDNGDAKEKTPVRAYLVAASGENVPLGADPVVVDSELVIAAVGKRLRFVDVEKVASTATITAPITASGTEDDPVGGVRIARFSDHLVIAHARPAGVMFVERGGTEKSRVAIPLCK